MSYPAIVDALARRAAPLAASHRLTVLRYEPGAVVVPRCLYFLLDGFDRLYQGQMVGMRYRVIARIAVRWQDNAAAETELADLINPVCIAFDPDATDPLVPAGENRVLTGEAGYIDIGSTRYRYCDVIVQVTEKGVFRNGV